MKNTHHCAHSLLPPVKSCTHYLRPKGHKYELPRCDLELYKKSYVPVASFAICNFCLCSVYFCFYILLFLLPLSYLTNRCTWQTSSLQRSPLPFWPEPHFVPHKKQPACGEQSRPTWRCVLNATVPKSDHRAFFRHLCRDLVAPWMMVFQL